MNGFETKRAGHVPERAMAAEPARTVLSGPVAVLLAGVVLNVGWVAVLGWASFRTVRWLFA